MALEDHSQFVASDELYNDIKMIVTHPLQANIVKSAKLHEWMAFVEEYLGPETELLTNEAVESFVKNMLSNGKKFTNAFPENHGICMTLLPCEFNGDRLNSVDIEDGAYICKLNLDPHGKTNLVTAQHRVLFDLMPPEIRDNCTFFVGNYTAAPEGEDVGVEDKKRVLSEFYRVLKNLQIFWSEYKKKNGHNLS